MPRYTIRPKINFFSVDVFALRSKLLYYNCHPSFTTRKRKNMTNVEEIAVNIRKRERERERERESERE